MKFQRSRGTKKVGRMILLAAGILVAMPMDRDAEAVVSKAFVTVGLTPSFTGVGSISFLVNNPAGTSYLNTTLLNQAASPNLVETTVTDANTISFFWAEVISGINTTSLPLFEFEYTVVNDQYPAFSLGLDQNAGMGIYDVNILPLSTSLSSFVLATRYLTDTGVTQYPVTVTVSGAGSGTVTSNPAGLTCTSGSCLYGFDANSQVTLMPTPSSDSYFKAWTGSCTGTGNCVISSLAAGATVGAEFAKYQAIRIAGTTSYFDTVQDAYNTATTGAVLEAMATTSTSLGPLTMNTAKTITLKGGYNGDYTPSTTLTTAVGTITVVAGTLIAQNIVVN
ncbi:hypothetical protein [Geobacter sulfurreducens]|uniref:hypothetical protein n=1 Tax=Geobacter sulfurreducens TaxID=35554 RepID=UPI000DBB5749|nr:hypothetical protein [Geobacter sulfurreducens]BBA70354.1 hypothetical protein YM18_1832 [Geobacter sulfurreducens]